MTQFYVDPDLYTAQMLSPDSITLTPEQVDWAVDLSQNAISEAEQWHTYLNLLALQGVQEWLGKRSPELSLQSDWLPDSVQPVKQNQADYLSQRVSELKIGKFKLYLVTSDCVNDPMVAIPQAVVERHSFDPDAYMLVEVLEELAQVRVSGYLPQLQLNHHLNHLEVEEKSWLMPLDEFTLDADNLLLHLRCSDPAQFRTPPVSEPINTHNPKPLVQAQTTAINAALWLRDQVDRVAEELSWILLPPLDLSGAMMSLRSGRSPDEDLITVMNELRREQAVDISADARVSHQNLQLGDVAIRLYALIWAIPDAVQPEWSLLFILGAQTGTQLPQGITLQVEDETSILVEETLEHAPYLYAQVVGTWDEQFNATIILPDGTPYPQAPFIFNPDAV